VGILIIVSFIITHQFDAKIVRLLGEIHRKENTVVARITDAFTNIFSVKILHIEKPLERGIMEASGAVKQTQFTFIRVQEWKWFCGAVIFTIINLIPLFVYLSLVNAGYETFEIGTFTALYLYSGNLIYVYYGFNSTFEEMIQQRTKILNAKDIEDAILKNARVRRKQVPKQWKRITFGDVQFGYQEGRMQVDGVTLTVRKGESVALIGASGSGKTTILKVIHGMYDQARGTYATDDHAPQATTFANIDLSSTLVPQEPEVFSSTIRENITLGMGYSDKEVRVATDMARFTDVIASLPNGLASVVNEKGVNLSGGQKQRLALARALLFGKDKQILLLDESTSSVDSENEGYIYEAIRKEFSNRVIIASIHKLNLLKYFDRVIMFDAGKVVDDGSFDELYARNGYFKEQWDEYLKTT
jgi:ABC-type bacteriocin/lantibiotic exporter with double-glycine peptidase domain